MQLSLLRNLALAFVLGVAVLAFSGWASADPPARVARLGYLTGAVSFSRAGEYDWVRATINRPLTNGDRLWTETGARSEIQVGGAMIRMNSGTGISVLNLDDRITQLQLSQGTLSVRVRHLEPDQVFEVDTPNLAFILRQAGAYRIVVDPDDDATTIYVRKGQGEVYGEDAAYVIDSRQAYRFYGTGLSDYEFVNVPPRDDFDRWASARDRRYDNSYSARYVSPDVVGYQDLDDYGTWRVDVSYGNVWIPNRVAIGWAPYRDGHWAWVDPWGWTWIDDMPWGFAVSHYGRWTNFGGTWGWVPGPVRTRAYYAPALVVFVGGSNFQLSISSGNVGGVAWFPLAPREVYRPSYPVSRSYFENINISNTVINTTVINNTYNNVNVTNVSYANRQVPGAVVAVPTTTFVQSQPVSRSAQRVSREVIGSAPVVTAPPVAPIAKSVRGAAVQGEKPPVRAFERPVVARTAPAAAMPATAAPDNVVPPSPQTAKPGQPVDNVARKEFKPATTVTAPVVKVITPAASPTQRPPPSAPGAKPGDARRKNDARKPQEAPVTGGAERPQSTQAVPAAESPEPRGKAEQRPGNERRGNSAQRRQPVAVPPPPVTQPVDEPKVAPAPGAPQAPAMQQPPQASPQATAPPDTPNAPTARPPEPRGKPDQRERPEASPAASPAEQRQRAAEPKALPSPATPAAQQPVPAEDASVQDSKPGADKQKGNKRGSEKPMTEEEKRQEEILRDEQLKEEEKLKEERLQQ